MISHGSTLKFYFIDSLTQRYGAAFYRGQLRSGVHNVSLYKHSQQNVPALLKTKNNATVFVNVFIKTTIKYYHTLAFLSTNYCCDKI